MANVKEIFGSLLMMFRILVSIGAKIGMMFFYFFFGPHWTQIFISFTVLLISLSVLVGGIVLCRLSKKSEEKASRSYKKTSRMIGIYFTIYGALITPLGILLNAFLIMITGIVILIIGIVLLLVRRKR
jgi:peptidoglycan/LPS O-acetylase OafA/YrhL